VQWEGAVVPRKLSYLRWGQALATALVLATTLVAPTAVSAAAPLTASNCSGHVCIYVNTSGSVWQTTAGATQATCTYADFWVNHVLVLQTATQCASAGTELEAEWTGASFPAGTLLCNTWPGIAGEPCETIGS
jgi:hypothetical protein